MKNKLKKVLCTALAAVSLSAMVTVPSSLNAPKSDNAIVNVMEADAAQKPLYTAYMTKDPKGKDRYYIREKDDPNSDVIQVAYPFAPLKVYKVSDKMVRVSPDNATEQWVRKSRVQRIYPDSQLYKTHSCHNYRDYDSDWRERDTVVYPKGKKEYQVAYYHQFCTVCGKELVAEPHIFRIVLDTRNDYGKIIKTEIFYSLDKCPDKIPIDLFIKHSMAKKEEKKKK